jgi:hypothetical protein
MKQAALGLILHTIAPAAVGVGLLGYMAFRVARGAWRGFVGA